MTSPNALGTLASMLCRKTFLSRSVMGRRSAAPLWMRYWARRLSFVLSLSLLPAIREESGPAALESRRSCGGFVPRRVASFTLYHQRIAPASFAKTARRERAPGGAVLTSTVPTARSPARDVECCESSRKTTTFFRNAERKSVQRVRARALHRCGTSSE